MRQIPRIVVWRWPGFLCCFVISQLALALVSTRAMAAGPATESPFAAASDYYPLRVGNGWQFEMTTAGKKQQMQYTVAKKETIDGVEIYRIDTMLGGRTVASEGLSSNDQGLYRNRYNGIAIDPPVCLLRNPVRRGDKWSVDTTTEKQPVTISCEVGAEDVKVAAGEFRAVKLTVRTSFDGVEYRSDYWMAANIGIVKQQLLLGKQEIGLELQEFIAAP